MRARLPVHPLSPGPEPTPSRPAADDLDLLPMALVVWIPSLVRVAMAFRRHEVFGVEATLAAVCLVGLPIWLASVFHHGGQRDGGAPGEGARENGKTESKMALYFAVSASQG